MVMMSLLVVVPAAVIHDREGLPFISTVQAPQAPSPQPYLLRVKFSWWRNTLINATSGSTFTSRFEPFTFKTLIKFFNDNVIYKKWRL